MDAVRLAVDDFGTGFASLTYRLGDLGSDAAQSDLLGRPRPADRITPMLG